jgi:hypothetical protein
MNITQNILGDDYSTFTAADDLIMKSGQSIRYLLLGGGFFSTDKEGNPKSMSHLLKLALEYCPNLESLCLRYFNIQQNMKHDILFEPEISLRHLELKNCYFYSAEYLTSILQRISYLKTLKLAFCIDLDAITGGKQTNSSIYMYMPNTSFHSICFK